MEQKTLPKSGYQRDGRLEVACCNEYSSSVSSSAPSSHFNPSPKQNVHWESSITANQIEELRKSPEFMSNPLGHLTQAGASNRDILKTLNYLSTYKPSSDVNTHSIISEPILVPSAAKSVSAENINEI